MPAAKFLLLSVAIFTVVWLVIPARDDFPATDYLDMHVHTAGLGYGNSGAFVSDELRSSYKFPIYLWAMDVTQRELDQYGDAIVIEKIAHKVRNSSRVGRAVVLAMDGVITDGRLDRTRTQIYVPNDFVAREVKQYPSLLFGASVNPYRRDAVQQLHEVKAAGAVVLKWIPNIMLIDPADPKLIPFYRTLAELELPLLTHAGQERSFAGADDTLGDPVRLRLPLEQGVTVIAAHIATTGTNEGVENYERILPLFEEFPNLYTEISSLTQINKRNYLVDALTRPELEGRLLYGTDWPLQFFPLVSPFYHSADMSISDIKGVLAQDNAWDRDVALKVALGVPESVFLRSEQILGQPEARD